MMIVMAIQNISEKNLRDFANCNTVHFKERSNDIDIVYYEDIKEMSELHNNRVTVSFRRIVLIILQRIIIMRTRSNALKQLYDTPCNSMHTTSAS